MTRSFLFRCTLFGRWCRETSICQRPLLATTSVLFRSWISDSWEPTLTSKGKRYARHTHQEHALVMPSAKDLQQTHSRRKSKACLHTFFSCRRRNFSKRITLSSLWWHKVYRFGCLSHFRHWMRVSSVSFLFADSNELISFVDTNLQDNFPLFMKVLMRQRSKQNQIFAFSSERQQWRFHQRWLTQCSCRLCHYDCCSRITSVSRLFLVSTVITRQTMNVIIRAIVMITRKRSFESLIFWWIAMPEAATLKNNFYKRHFHLPYFR